MVASPAVEPEYNHSEDGDDSQSVLLLAICGRKGKERKVKEERTYTKPIANITLTPAFFRADRFSFEISYTGISTMAVSTAMLTNALTNVTVIKSIHWPVSSPCQAVHDRCTGRHRNESVNIQVTAMAAFNPMMV